MQEIKLDLENYEIWFEPFWQTIWFKISLACFLSFLLVCSFLLFKRLIKQKNNAKLTIDDIINEIKKLDKQVENENQQRIYIELILLLKKFIFTEYKLDFFSKTEREIFEFFRSKNEQKKYEIIDQLLNNSIYRKFSLFQMENVQIKNDLNNVVILVKEMNQSNKSSVNSSAS